MLVLPNTPSVLSIGRLIEDHGCTFSWTPGEASITDPDGGVHMCEVCNYVPHLDGGRDHDHHQHSEDSCYLCQALPAGAADDGNIEQEAPDVAANMEGDLENGEYLDHELHHLPKRADCFACAQAKIKMKPARRRDPAMRERPAAWGHTLMGDHLSAADLSLDRVDLKLGITLLDASTLYGDLIVVRSKNVNDTIMAFREFYGEDPFYYFHSDNAKELKAAAEQELMVHLTSTPHRPESNGVVERFNQLIVDGARCLLLQSGLPGRFWHYACRAFLLARNARVKGKDERTPWNRRFGREFHGKVLPFGCRVLYRRPRHDAAKFAPRGSEGIFLGHHLEPGGMFKGDYLILSLDNLLNEDNPESGALWEKHLSSILITLGWKKCDSHPGIWIHTSGAVLAVYVDDLLMVAPRDKEEKLWADIAAQVTFDEEQAPIGKFLGAHHVFKKDGNVTTLTVEMEDFMKDAAEIYAAEIGAKKLAEARTPYLPENVWDFAPKGGEQAGEQ